MARDSAAFVAKTSDIASRQSLRDNCKHDRARKRHLRRAAVEPSSTPTKNKKMNITKRYDEITVRLDSNKHYETGEATNSWTVF
jgi:hypothetical protein